MEKCVIRDYNRVFLSRLGNAPRRPRSRARKLRRINVSKVTAIKNERQSPINAPNASQARRIAFPPSDPNRPIFPGPNGRKYDQPDNQAIRFVAFHAAGVAGRRLRRSG